MSLRKNTIRPSSFFVTQSVVITIGINAALFQYSRNQKELLGKAAKQILLGSSAAAASENIKWSGPLFVFRADKSLLYSNRGKGKAIQEDEYLPVKHDDTVIGYYYSGETRFVENEANRAFLSTIIAVLVISVIGSLVTGMILSLIITRRIVQCVTVIRDDVSSLATLKLLVKRQFGIRELNDIAESLHRVSQKLSSEEEAKKQFLQDIIHDLKTPVAGIKSQLEAMADGVLEVSTNRIGKNLNELNRLELLIRDITDWYRTDTETRLSITELDLKKLISEVLSRFELEAQEKTIRVDLHYSKIFGDRKQLFRLIENIISNAIQHGGETIVITCGKEGSWVRLSVGDNGRGMPADQISLLFNRFYRGDYSRNSLGSGLGLSIAKKIAESHGGTVTAAAN